MNIDPDNPQSQVKRKNKAGRLALLTVCALALSLLIPVWLQAAWQEKAQNDPPPKPVEASGARQKITRNGITIELAFQPLGAADQAAELIEGSDYEISVRLADGASGTPLAGLRPAAWIDPRIGAQSSDAKVCREKIQTYVRGSLRARPEIDLNNFYILALNNESNISVIDPLLSFGGSKLLTLIRLNSPGEDWRCRAISGGSLSPSRNRIRLRSSTPVPGKSSISLTPARARSGSCFSRTRNTCGSATTWPGPVNPAA